MTPKAHLPLFGTPGAPAYEKVAACVHCGLCLEACPTYRELRVEMDSPRGRIYLMKGLLGGKLTPDATVLKHLDQCLDCRACETACPSGVEYGEILERTRTLLQPTRRRAPLARFFRWLIFTWLLPSRRAQRWVFRLLRLQQSLGLTAAAAWLSRHRFLPGRLGSAARQAPPVPAQSFRDAHAGAYIADRAALVFPARGERRHRVALFTGCLADHLFAGVNEASLRALTENGCEVEVLAAEGCCGALHIHNGARNDAKALARANVAAFNPRNFDAIVSNAAGCSAELRRYTELLEDEPGSRAFSAKVRDIAEFLCEIGFRVPTNAGAHRGPVAYAEPCHLVHAQKISAAPKRLLLAIPGLTLVPLANADTCCGSAGLYSLLEPHLAEPIASRKLAAIAESRASIVATGNPGCLMQIRSGVGAARLPVAVVHPVELLADAYRASFGA